MYAIAVSDFGGPEVLELRDIPIPEPWSCATAVAHAPRGTPHEHAATIPLAGLTADEALVGELGATDFVARTDALGQSVRNLAPSGVDAVIDTAVIGIVAHEALRGGGTFVALVAPLAEAANAHRLVERGGQRGRIVLRA